MPRWPWRRTASSADALADATLMARVVAGDDDAFAHLVTGHERALYNYLLRMVPDEVLTDDLMQETWLRVFQNVNRHDTTRKFTTWLSTIAYHFDEERRHSKSVPHQATADEPYNRRVRGR